MKESELPFVELLFIIFTFISLFLTIENLLDVEWNEAQFDTESRLFHKTEPVSEIHFTPGNPLNLQAGISFQF